MVGGGGRSRALGQLVLTEPRELHPRPWPLAFPRPVYKACLPLCQEELGSIFTYSRTPRPCWVSKEALCAPSVYFLLTLARAPSLGVELFAGAPLHAETPLQAPGPRVDNLTLCACGLSPGRSWPAGGAPPHLGGWHPTLRLLQSHLRMGPRKSNLEA